MSWLAKEATGDTPLDNVYGLLPEAYARHKALVEHMNHPDDSAPLQEAIDRLTDTLLSHLSYEEVELVEPLARLGFYPGQL